MPQDDLTLTIRVHDPLEKKDAAKSASWAVVKIPRADVGGTLSGFDFLAKHVQPALSKLVNVKLNA
jgi:hypothetical protein